MTQDTPGSLPKAEDTTTRVIQLLLSQKAGSVTASSCTSYSPLSPFSPWGGHEAQVPACPYRALVYCIEWVFCRLDAVVVAPCKVPYLNDVQHAQDCPGSQHC